MVIPAFKDIVNLQKGSPHQGSNKMSNSVQPQKIKRSKYGDNVRYLTCRWLPAISQGQPSIQPLRTTVHICWMWLLALKATLKTMAYGSKLWAFSLGSLRVRFSVLARFPGLQRRLKSHLAGSRLKQITSLGLGLQLARGRCCRRWSCCFAWAQRSAQPETQTFMC